ncbi:MAG: aldehyde ferredoxin oxidoreductase C-terminal domain-containing protein [Candidatus Helarchaeota archaeon]
MDYILRINMNSLEIKKDPVPADLERFGGRSFIGKILSEEVPPKCHPLGQNNKLIFAAGLLAGTGFPNSCRISVGGKSPLTGGIKESNSGGRFAYEMVHLALRGLIVEGKPTMDAKNNEELYTAVIESDNVELVETSELKNKGNYETVSWLRRKFGSRIATASIGPAGELKLSGATIAFSDLFGVPDRHAGRGGLGAIMGSKSLKAMVLKPAKRREMKFRDEASFKDVSQSFGKKLIETKRVFSKFGTPVMIDVCNEHGGLPTQNFRRGRFNKVDKISGNKLHELLVERNGKFGLPCSPSCCVKCSNRFNDASGKPVTKIEYETIAMMGSNLLIDDYDVIARMNYLCNDLGLDTIETGNALAVLMESSLLDFGDHEKVLQILTGLYKGDILSRIVGSGAAVVGKIFGVDRVPVVKGQALPAYDPRVFKGMAATFAVSPMGADHTAGPAIPGRAGLDPNKDYGSLTDNVGKIDLTKDLHYVVAMLEAMGCCYFIYHNQIMEKVSTCLEALHGWKLSPDDLLQMGKDIIKREIEFNENAGLSRTDDLPEFFRSELLPETEDVYDIPENAVKTAWDDLF